MDIGFNVSASRATKMDPAFIFSFMKADRLSGMKLDTRLTLNRPRLIDTRFQFEGVSNKNFINFRKVLSSRVIVFEGLRFSCKHLKP